MELHIVKGTGKRTEAIARGHHVICDQPLGEGGSDAGMTPPELMLAAIGCCAMHYAAEYLKARNLPRENVEIKVSGEKGGGPVRIVEIGITVNAPGLEHRMREGLLKAVEACLLHRTLSDPPRVQIGITTSAMEDAVEPLAQPVS